MLRILSKYYVYLIIIFTICLLAPTSLRAQLQPVNSYLSSASEYNQTQKNAALLFSRQRNFHSGKLGDEIFLSLKMGYHSPFERDNIDGIPGGLVFDGSAEFFLGKNCYLGGNVEYWNSSNMISIPESLTEIERSNSATSFAISFKIRKDIGKVNIVLGGLIGNCSMTSSSVFGESAKNYLSVAFLFGFDVLVSRKLAITSQFEYRSLSRWEDTHKSFFGIKIGPTLILK